MIPEEAVNRQAEARLKKRQSDRDFNVEQLSYLKDPSKEFDWTKIENATRLAERARLQGMAEAAGELLRDPKDTEVGRRIYEQIIDANNLLGITFLFKGAECARAVGRITLPVTGGTRLGTGFMVSPRVMMTNNHVLGDSVEAGNATLEFDFYTRDDGTTGPINRFRLQPNLLFVTDGPLDFTLVAIEETNADGALVSDRGWFPLIGPSGKALIGERVSIIQHPSGDPQMVTVHDNKVVDINDDFLHYVTDTMGGSSGSPVLNIDWALAALHHAAVGNSNEGIRISSIVAKLQEIFAEESSGSAVSADIISELMAGKAPSRRPTLPDRAAPSSAIADYGPRINPDGTASWIVPVSVTLGVGQPGGVISGSTLAMDVSDQPGEEPPEPATSDADLQAALRALEDTEGKVYYSKTKDDEARENYYPDLSGMDGEELFNTLSDLLRDTHTTSLSYKTARLTHLYPWIDRRDGSNQALKGIYSNKVFDALEVIRQEARMERLREQAIQERIMQESFGAIDEAFLEELEALHPFNCEHVVPQSWFNKRKQPKTDLHHLFTCEWGCNSFRGNRAYFDFELEAFREDCGESADGKFEPKGGKGAVARATLYFLLRYPGDIADSDNEMPKNRLKTVIDWANGDKVDRWERHRNAEIQKVQGNRNPLIDFPELAVKIAFDRGFA